MRLSRSDIVKLKNSAKEAQRVEDKWAAKVTSAISEAAERSVNGETYAVPDFERLFIEHWFETNIAAFRVADSEREYDKRPRPAPRLRAAYEFVLLAKAPRSLRDIMRAYDLWRKGLFKPRGPVKSAKAMKELYLKTVAKAWKKYSRDFREGGEQTQAEIKSKVKKAAETTAARANVIVRTETTNYYNKARKDYYDQAEDVTHYMFLAVRDKGTTPWCCRGVWSGDPKKRKQYDKRYGSISGKSGRSGLVYKKGSAILSKETPAIHYGCRSELLPLNRFNPYHQRLIADPKIRRENVECYPLPPDFRRAA